MALYFFVPNQRSSYFPVPFMMSYTECNVIIVVFNNLCIFVNFVVNKL